MIFKQLYFPNNFKPVENDSDVKNGSVKSLDIFIADTVSNKANETRYTIQIQELKEDVSRLEKLVEQRTNKLNEVITTNTKFISILAHDLKSPFSSVLCALELIKDKLNNNDIDDIEKFVNIASDSANKTLHLLKSLLEWVVMQNEEKSFKPVKINLHEFVIPIFYVPQ
jgi:signal transduction histidine kinase